MDFNKSILSGRLAQDPTLKTFKNGKGEESFRCAFPLAVTRMSDRGQKDRTKRRTNYIWIVAWGDPAKRHATYLKKGTSVLVEGELIRDSIRQADGTFKDFIYVQVRDVQYGPKSQKNTAAQPADVSSIAAQLAAMQARIDQLTGAPAAGIASEGTPFGDAPVADATTVPSADESSESPFAD